MFPGPRDAHEVLPENHIWRTGLVMGKSGTDSEELRDHSIKSIKILGSKLSYDVARWPEAILSKFN